MRAISMVKYDRARAEPTRGSACKRFIKANAGTRRYARWDFDIQRLGDQRAELVSTRIKVAIESARLAGQPAPAGRPGAESGSRRAAGGEENAAEAPMLRFAKLGGTWMERGMDDELWQAIANLHREDVKLDEASVAVDAEGVSARPWRCGWPSANGGRKIRCCEWCGRLKIRWRSTRCAMSICCIGGFTSGLPTSDIGDGESSRRSTNGCMRSCF